MTYKEFDAVFPCKKPIKHEKMHHKTIKIVAFLSPFGRSPDCDYL